MANKARINLILKRIWIGAAVLIILAAVFSSLFRSLTPWAKQHKKDVERSLSQLIGQPVTVQSLETGWYWFHPVLKLGHITIRDEQRSIHLEKLFLGVNLLKSLIHWRIQPGLLYLEDGHLVVRKQTNVWQIDGIKTPKHSTLTASETLEQLITALAQQERLIIRDLSIDIYVDDKKLLPITDFNLSMVNKGGHYKIKGGARVDPKKPTVLKLLADLNFDPAHYKETQGRVFFSAKKIRLLQWQELISPMRPYVKNGSGTIALWLDLNHGEVSSAQAELSLSDLFLDSKDKESSIPSFHANMAWKPTNKGWQFNADQIQLDLGKTHWPENQVSVHFDALQQTYLVFAKSIIVESLVKAGASQWPQWAQQLNSLKPRGNLSDFQLVLKDKQVNYLLTRFDQLSWAEYAQIPAVTNLSGVIQWEPQEGHLELDSENTSIALRNYPQQNLNLLNGVIDWKELSNGLRVSIDRFALSQPELTLSMQGVLDDVRKNSLGTIRLGLEFSAKNIQQWMPYLPKEHMKTKLFTWLNKDIKRIAQATGKVQINGAAKDFPFDNNSGEFSLVSHAMGGDILITPKWQLIKDLEGYIRLKNRNLEIDIVDGNAQGVPIKQMHLRIDDVGKDKETLLIHSIVDGPAQKMLNFIIASPLKEKLIKLKMLALKGAFLLDLNIEVPLYPENDDNLVKGKVTLKNNEIQIKHHMASIKIEDVSGNLSFDEAGVNESALIGTAFDYPLDIKIQSIKTPKTATLIAINGECTIESLKSKFNFPIFSLFKGMFSINALFKITTDPNDLDNLTLNSSLEGLAINAPLPLGKKYKDVAPLQVNLDFNTEKAIRLRSNYNHKLSTDLLFEQNSKKEFALKSGQISLGNNTAVDQKTPGLSIVGSLDGFNIEEWKKLFSRFSDNKNSFVLNNLRSFDLKLNKLSFLQQEFDNLAVKGNILPNQDWTLRIKQKKVLADLTYNVAGNLISGFVQHLYLNKIKLAKTDNSVSDLSPEQIPNLNLRVDKLTIGDVLVGDLTLKSHSNQERWSIDYCRIDSPAYQLMIGGDWVQKNKINHTDLQLKLHFNNLGKSLALWGLTPAVDAKKGDLTFNGGWKGSINDFSLAGLNGSMYLQLNNGRITHLSPETEEKLGLGKLLSILSLQTIPRRLKLDFSDLSHDGYSFDIFKGNFVVGKGIMNTQDSYLDGPVAYANMKGDLDIVRRMYDLNLNISPHITASLPVVATIAGGPIAGLAAWVASKIINQGMQKISAYSYKISGPWDQPVVQQLRIIKKIIKK